MPQFWQNSQLLFPPPFLQSHNLFFHDFSWLNHQFPTVWDILQVSSLRNEDFSFFKIPYLEFSNLLDLTTWLQYFFLVSLRLTQFNAFPGLEAWFLQFSTVFVHKTVKNRNFDFENLQFQPDQNCPKYSSIPW